MYGDWWNNPDEKSDDGGVKNQNGDAEPEKDFVFQSLLIFFLGNVGKFYAAENQKEQCPQKKQKEKDCKKHRLLRKSLGKIITFCSEKINPAWEIPDVDPRRKNWKSLKKIILLAD